MAKTTTVIQSTTQDYLEIHDITNDILILKDGSTAMILSVNAMNFGLLAEPEQDAIMYSYAGLLNSLNFPIQILVRSQTKDVTSYLTLLKEEEDKTASQLKKNWISRYREFVADLIHERNVLDKKFYVVIPASALDMGLLPPSSVIPGQQKPPDFSNIEKSVIMEKAREVLEPRRDHLLGQFGRIGLASRQLATQEIIQLFYVGYNPEAAEGQQITDTRSYTTPLVQASMTQTPTGSGASPAMQNMVQNPPQQAYEQATDQGPNIPPSSTMKTSPQPEFAPPTTPTQSQPPAQPIPESAPQQTTEPVPPPQDPAYTEPTQSAQPPVETVPQPAQQPMPTQQPQPPSKPEEILPPIAEI